MACRSNRGCGFGWHFANPFAASAALVDRRNQAARIMALSFQRRGEIYTDRQHV